MAKSIFLDIPVSAAAYWLDEQAKEEEVVMEEQASDECANLKRQEFCIMDVMTMADLEVA
jgi:hypothetical protein